jgi:hypothetical protein
MSVVPAVVTAGFELQQELWWQQQQTKQHLQRRYMHDEGSAGAFWQVHMMLHEMLAGWLAG